MGFSVFALGGAGAIGSECSRAILQASDLDRLTIADQDIAGARALVERLGDSRLDAVTVDIHDVATTARLARGHDLLMNTLFWAHFDDALSVACAAGCNYADLLSHPTQEQRERAQGSGITAVCGLGASPGIGNVLGRKACASFDEPLSLEIACTSFRSIAPSEGLLDTMIELATPALPQRGYFFHGRFVPSEPMEGSKVVDFGAPVGRVLVYYINHSEVSSFPRHYPSLQYVAVRGSYRPSLMQDMRVLASYGLLDDEIVGTTDGESTIKQVVRNRIWEVAGGREDFDSHHLYIHVEARGRKSGLNGTSIHRASHPLEWGTAAIPRMTGVGAAVGVILIGRQGRTKVGLCDPEEYFDADLFLEELTANSAISISEQTSWEDAPQ